MKRNRTLTDPPKNDSRPDPDNAVGVVTPEESDAYPTDIEVVLADIECLARSANRLRILYLLRQSPSNVDDIEDELGVHRTTLKRNLSELKVKNWVRSSPTETIYRLSSAGQLVIEGFDQLIRTTRTSERIGSFLGTFPETAPVEVECLRACRITCPEFSDPHAPMTRLLTLISDSATLRGFTPVLGPASAQVLIGQISDKKRIELIIGSTAYDSLRSRHRSLFESLTETDTANLLVSDNVPSYGVRFLDELVVLIAYDENMRIHSILEADDSQKGITEWAEHQYGEQKEATN